MIHGSFKLKIRADHYHINMKVLVEVQPMATHFLSFQNVDTIEQHDIALERVRERHLLIEDLRKYLSSLRPKKLHSAARLINIWCILSTPLCCQTSNYRNKFNMANTWSSSWQWAEISTYHSRASMITWWTTIINIYPYVTGVDSAGDIQASSDLKSVAIIITLSIADTWEKHRKSGKPLHQHNK